MRNNRLALFVVVASIVCTSCEKVIDIDLNDAEKKYVIEGILTDQVDSTAVYITQSKNFSDDNTFAGISDATVTIIDSEGTITTLDETTAGIYKPTAFTGVSGKTYTLKVTIAGNAFTGVSTMPTKINMDSLYITEDNLFGEVRKTANVQYQDPPGLGQSYRFIQYWNGKKEKNIFIRNDDYTDGNESVVKLRTPGDGDDEIKTGDKLKVDMLCIDAGVYKYWYSFEAGGASGDNNSASPANPVSNIQGGALGYFSAQTVQSKTVTVP